MIIVRSDIDLMGSEEAIDAALSGFVPGCSSVCNSTDDGDESWMGLIQAKTQSNFCSSVILKSVRYFVNVSHLSSILQTLIKRHAPSTTGIVEPLLVLLS